MTATIIPYRLIASDTRLAAGVPAVPVRGIPLDRYTVEHDVPVFSEHERTLELSSGEVVTDRYSRQELEWIVDNQNRKIENTGDYVPIVIRHTENLDGSVHDAPVVGFAGPFKLGMLGEIDPKYCILAENWYIRNDLVELAAAYPRRSVELWRHHRAKDRFFDPISLLGAESPHLDLGLLYSRRGPDGPPVICYSAASPSAGAVFTPQSDFTHNEEEGDMDGELSAAAIKQVIDAFESTAYVQWTMKKMAEEQAANMTEGLPATPLAPDVPMGAMPAAMPGQQPAQPAAQKPAGAQSYRRQPAPASTSPGARSSTTSRQSVDAHGKAALAYALSHPGTSYERAKELLRYGEN